LFVFVFSIINLVYVYLIEINKPLFQKYNFLAPI